MLGVSQASVSMDLAEVRGMLADAVPEDRVAVDAMLAAAGGGDSGVDVDRVAELLTVTLLEPPDPAGPVVSIARAVVRDLTVDVGALVDLVDRDDWLTGSQRAGHEVGARLGATVAEALSALTAFPAVAVTGEVEQGLTTQLARAQEWLASASSRRT
jgi:hypothetical protein